MKDIKSIKKSVEKIYSFQHEQNVYEVKKKTTFANGFYNKTIFSFMLLSFFSYIFFISSTVYFSVQTQKTIFAIDNISSFTGRVALDDKIDVKDNNLENTTIKNQGEIYNGSNSKMSFINKNGDKSISMK